MSENERLGIWLVDPSGFSPPLFLAVGHPRGKHLEFLRPDDRIVRDIHFYSLSFHITPISGKLPFTYDQDQVIAQAEWSSVQFVRYDKDIGNTWAITDMFIPARLPAISEPEVLAIPWSPQP